LTPPFSATKPTIEDVAAAANVSRATASRYFAARDEMILGVLLRERFLDRLTAEIDREPDFDRALINGVLFTVDAVRADQNLALLFTSDAIGITTAVAGASAALFSLTTDLLRPSFRAAQEAGRVRADIGLTEPAEWTFARRTLASHCPGTGRSDAR
jgi:AcrR family transcriptional regulator